MHMPMPSTRKSYYYILTIIDAFTKFVWMFPTKTTSAQEVLKKLEVVATMFGNPRRIFSDRRSDQWLIFRFEILFDSFLLSLRRAGQGDPEGSGRIFYRRYSTP